MSSQTGGPRPAREPGELAALRIDTDNDVFSARQAARVLGREAGLDGQDQVRLATAVSEVGRDALAAGGAWLILLTQDPATLVVRIVADNPLPADATGLSAAARLVQVVQTEVNAHHVIELAKALPAGNILNAAWGDALRRALAQATPVLPSDELRLQNAELVTALEQLQDRQLDLERLNAELEDTNRGVLALYNQLSDELEETNRGVVALYAEIDERGLALERANNAKTRFLRHVSHELRAPVNSVLGLSRLLLDPTADPLTHEQQREIELIQASSTDLLGLVNDLLDLAKAESGTLEAHYADIDLRALLVDIEDLMRPVATRPEVRMAFDVPEGLGPLHSDAGLLRRVLRNLLTNALKFTERGEVRVRVLADSAAASPPTASPPTTSPPATSPPTALDTVVVQVSDTGIGIAPADQDRVFDEFYQVHTPLQARVRGTGLGLPYARRVCELLGGTLTLQSQPGAGSTFTVTLPRRPAPPEDTPGQPQPAAALPGPEPVPHLATALVVDDDPAFRARMRAFLDGRAAHVLEAEDGQVALDLLRTERPDVLFLDLMLPVMSGSEVLAVIAREPALHRIPVIVVTWREHAAASSTGSALAILAKSALSQTAIDALLTRVLTDPS